MFFFGWQVSVILIHPLVVLKACEPGRDVTLDWRDRDPWTTSLETEVRVCGKLWMEVSALSGKTRGKVHGSPWSWG